MRYFRWHVSHLLILTNTSECNIAFFSGLKKFLYLLYVSNRHQWNKNLPFQPISVLCDIVFAVITVFRIHYYLHDSKLQVNVSFWVQFLWEKMKNFWKVSVYCYYQHTLEWSAIFRTENNICEFIFIIIIIFRSVSFDITCFQVMLTKKFENVKGYNIKKFTLN